MDPHSVNSDGNEAKESALLNEESSEKIVDKSNEKETISNNEERLSELANQIEAKKDAKIDGGIKVVGSPSTRLSTSTKAAISSAASNGNCSLLDVAALIASQNLARTTGATEEDDDEEIVNLADLTDLDNVGDMEAEALLGGQNDLVCTYPEGYKYRQPLYSCKTCFEESGQRAGVCYACALNCHDDHDLVELYTKRKFCCDCGNAKFKSKCMLYQEKQPENQFNCYNHNFGGIYCACRRPYPPPPNDEPNAADGNDGKTEAVPDDAMVQCVICEDWFHLSHIFSSDEQKNNVAVRDEMRRISTGSDTPAPAAIGITANLSTTSLTNEEDGINQPPPPSSRELVCNSCTERLKFVLVYAHHIAKQQQANEVEKFDCQTKTTNEGKEECVETIIKSTEVEATTEKGDTDATREIPLSTDTEGSTTETGAVQLNATNKCAILPTNTDKKPTGNDEKVAVEVKCLLKKFSSEMTPNEREENVGKGVLLDSVWRNLLCRCEDCQILYESHECMFLLDPEDTMEFYDAQRRANMAAKGEPSVEEQILMTKELVNDPLAVYKIVANETNNVDVALEVQKGFEEMSQKIQRMIRECSAEGRPVKSADVKRCFGELIEQREAKRRRLMETEEDDDDNEPAWTQ